jgi:hypothetical protein
MPVTETAIAALDRLLTQAFDALDAIAESGVDADLVALLTRCENAARRLDRTAVSAVAALERRGVFAEKGYNSSAAALADLLGWEGREARLTPEQWVGAEAALAVKAGAYTPSELQAWGAALIEALDQDGAEPDDRPSAQVNELQLTRLASGGGRLKGRFDDAAMFDAIARLIDAKGEAADRRRRSAGRAAAGRGPGRCVRLRPRPRPDEPGPGVRWKEIGLLVLPLRNKYPFLPGSAPAEHSAPCLGRPGTAL